jgi:O-antigen ligase
MEQLKRKAAAGIFALLVTAAPLLFGAVDRQVQIALTALLGVGLILMPPVMPSLTRWGKWIPVLWFGLLVLKEFAPSFFFGHTGWHTVLSQDFGVVFPWTHNPEPGRAVDILLMILAGASWFLWVRTLANKSGFRQVLVWSLLGSAAVLAVVCLSVRPVNPNAIYGMRFTPGWRGYGPFPNRNHTACFLAMGALIGCGCLTNATRHRKQLQAVVSFVCLLLIFVAMVVSQSRGALLSFTVGLAVFCALVLFNYRNRAALTAVVLGALFFAILILAFGTKVIFRFHASGSGEIASNLRWDIWKNALIVWKDAPLFGHGLGTFTQIFPIYQTLKLENQIVLHPESSWLLWLVELGMIPLLIAVGTALFFLVRNVAVSFEMKRGFVMRASGFAALSVLAVHSLWDVPAHRWAVAGFALAILAVVSPWPTRGEKNEPNNKAALLPFGIAAFWLIPFISNFPAWSPASLTRLLSRDENLISVSSLDRELRCFPLSPSLHQLLGMRLLADYRDAQSAWLEFRVADRLVPSSWALPAAQAVASQRFSPGMALHFWSLAVERAGHRGEEVFLMACKRTAQLPLAPSFWNNYVVNNPSLLLSYRLAVSDADGRYYFQRWWNSRAFNNDLADFEISNFYKQVTQFGSIANIYEWMAHHPDWEERDCRNWATLLHHWGDDATAWKILSRWIKEPPYPVLKYSINKEQLEDKWFAEPSNIMVAQALACMYSHEGKADQARQVILAVAAQETAPPWFLQKAAYLQAGEGRFQAAVSSLLRER